MNEIDISSWCLVIPSIRNINLEFIKHVPSDLNIIVVDDSDGSISPNRENMRVFDYTAQKQVMGKDYDLIPHKTAACRNFGCYLAWKEGYEIIITQDDDCVLPEGFVEGYSLLGKKVELTTHKCDGWYNTISVLNTGKSLFARGYPYDERHDKDISISKSKAKVVCNHGLWSKYLDFNGIDKYVHEKYARLYSDLTMSAPHYRILSKFSFCGMNFGFIRDATVIMAQIAQGMDIMDDYFLWRFDDIWAGYVIQSLVEIRNDAITIGQPLVVHSKAGNLKREVCGEHYGQIMSPYFYQSVDRAVEQCRSDQSYVELYATFAQGFASAIDKDVPRVFLPLFKRFADVFMRWAKLFV